ncbi:MAG: ABC transporter permease [Rhodobacteraceae bacterium]|jgi:phospholipid/cholesterol/gamma-HCH transport system permease protein|nr:ABC transporter permease [Paracoccaceae bacterium]MAT01350.1 ABC transporter permease [Paracoccaceae bacterium]MBL6855553.1 ABC transporter permease [Paracoccaceae bacterium]MDC0039730.1 ABC transporter permease [Paracoccaceae bacterium]|tara:strand:+ start:3191 stop:3979 length:789 start_codon:yes stop_codon:yes gene_type:complete
MTLYKFISSVLRPIGKSTLDLCQVFGKISLFVISTFTHIIRPPFYWRELLSSIFNIGYLSLPVVGLTALFTGAALALQIYSGGARFNAESVVPSIVAIGMVRELGPVLGGLMVAGRVSASIAAEIGTMKVTEQIDALTTLSTNPMKYLTVPRVLAATLSLPILVAIGDIIGIMGGYLVAINRLDFNSATYLNNTLSFLEGDDIMSGLIKASVFGFIVAIMGCFHGMNSDRGAQGVGKATTNAVVSASVLILTTNYLLTELFF